MLVFTYRIFDGAEPAKLLDHAEMFQREFTSIVYGVMKDNKVTEKLHKATGKFVIREITYGDLLKLDLEALQKLLKDSRDYK